MKLPYFEYRAPASLPQAVAMLAALGSDAKVLAGGQSLLPMMRYRLAQPAVLLDLARVPGLAEVAWTADGWEAGAMVTHAQLGEWQDGSPLAGLLAAHARQIAFPAVRSRGTLGGSLVHADPAGDWPLLFSALHACVHLAGQRGARTLPLAAFIEAPLETAIAMDELLVSVRLDAAAAGLTRWGRAKIMHRAGEYATSAAVAVQLADGRWSCWAGAAPPRPSPLPLLAAAMTDASGRLAMDALVDCAAQDIRDAFPEENEVAVHRHAVTAARAALHALEYDACPTT